MYNHNDINSGCILCEPIAAYSSHYKELSLFPPEKVGTEIGDIRVIELFAGVGGFRIGLERASKRFKTVWNNQWEPSTKRQDASIIYCKRFGAAGHSNEDISTVDVKDIPDADMLVGGFPCQDYSVATTLKHSGGIEGKKGANSIDQVKNMANAVSDSVKHITFSAPAYVSVTRASEPALGAYASKAEVNKLTGPIKGNAGVYMIQVYNKEKSAEEFDAKNEENNLSNMAGRYASSFINDLYKKAEVKDDRYLYF